MNELRCGACHEGMGVPPRGPDLSDVGRRVNPDYLKHFIANPARMQRGTKMPGRLHTLEPGERDVVAEAITHFLVARCIRKGTAPPESSGAGESAVVDGENLFHTIGCVACHAPRRPVPYSQEIPIAGREAVNLEHIPAKYSVLSLAAFLFEPLRIRPSGRMPDMGLSRSEAHAIASYLIGPDPEEVPKLEVQPELAAAGERYYQEFGCTACHPLEGQSAKPRLRDTGSLDPRAGCMEVDPPNGPRYYLDDGQRAAIAQALAVNSNSIRGQELGRESIALTLTTFNCIACHVRDDYGGVLLRVNPYFETDQHDLGDEARIPPQLTLAGAKLKSEWMRKVLFDGASVRPYMQTRMPRFGEDNLAHLPELFERVDANKIEPFAMPLPKGEEANVARKAGRELMGVRGLACIACHDFNHKPSPTHRGVDLINSPERLQPSWFARFLIDPQAYRPGIVMPESWSGGVATHTGILEGDTEAQIQALWYFLSQGRTARDPEGISAVHSTLVVSDATRTYRGRSQVAGYRGIAVGFPGGFNYAFNAQTGTLSALWQGDFVSVRWDGQGAGGFNPSERPIQLAQDVSFIRLHEKDAPWPLRPRMDEQNPINPDPLYPRNHGYRFRGYVLDENAIPTFRYSNKDVCIEDRSQSSAEGPRPVLRRTLRFSTPTEQQLFFRVLTGEFEVRSASEIITPQLRLTLPDVPHHVRTPKDDSRPGELLLELNLPARDSSITLSYELL